MSRPDEIVALRAATNAWALTLGLRPLVLVPKVDGELRSRAKEIAAMLYQAGVDRSFWIRAAVDNRGMAPGADGLEIYAMKIAQSFLAAAKRPGIQLGHPAGPREQPIPGAVLGAAAVGIGLLLFKKKGKGRR